MKSAALSVSLAVAVFLGAATTAGCASNYSHGEVHYVDAMASDYSFEAIRSRNSERVLRCRAADVRRFVNTLNAASPDDKKVQPPSSADGAVLLAIGREDLDLGGVYKCWISIDGNGGEIEFETWGPHPSDGHTWRIGTWAHWTQPTVDAWNVMLMNARPMSD